MASKRSRAALVAGLGSALVLGVGLGAAAIAVLADGSTTVVRQVTVEDSDPVAVGGVSASEIYERASQAVVEISAGGASSRAQGSGFVYDRVGHVVTNQHVVAAASSISVSFWNGGEREAQQGGAEPTTPSWARGECERLPRAP